MAAKRRRRTSQKIVTLKPVKVNAAVQKAYRDKLQAANVNYKKQVDKKAAIILREIDKLDRSKPGAFQKQVAKIQKRVASLEVNLRAANKKSTNAVRVFVNQMEKENTRRTNNSFKGKVDLKLQEFLLSKKNGTLKKRTEKLRKEYTESITAANRNYSDRVQQALYEKLGNPNVNARKKITAARGIVTRRIKNTVTNQAHELNATLNNVKQRALGVRRYIWQTREDERVRTSHDLVNKRVFQYGKPPAETGRFEPGQDFGCRCIAIPVVEDE